MVVDVSPEALSDLAKRCREGKAESDEYGALEEISTLRLNDYVCAAPSKRLRQESLLKLFLELGGNSTLAACRLDMSDRTAQDWVKKFSEFLTEQVVHERTRTHRYQAALAQCQESCGRQSHGGPSFGSAAFTGAARTSQSAVATVGRCSGCPLTGMGK